MPASRAVWSISVACATVTDENGTPVTISISGGGYVQLTMDATTTGKIDALDIGGATARTHVTITTPFGTTTSIGEISADGSVASIVAPHVVLDGNMTINGTAAQIVLGDVTAASGAEDVLSIDQKLASDGQTHAFPAGKLATAITLGNVQDLQIDSDMAIKSLKAVSWLDGQSSGQLDSITAPSLANLMVTGASGHPGDFQPDVTLNGSGASMPALTASIAGTVSVGDWTVGNVRSLTVGRWFTGTLTSSGTVGLIATRLNRNSGAADGSFAATLDVEHGSVSAAYIFGNLSGQWTIISAGNITVGADVNQWTGIFSQEAAPTRALSSLKVAGSIMSSDILSNGNIGSIQAGTITDSNIYAGYLDAGDFAASALAGLPATPLDDTVFNPYASIGSVTVRGLLESRSHVDSFINSDIVAAKLGTMNIAYAKFDNTGKKFGLAANSITRLNYHDATTSYTWPNPTDATPESFTDFIIRVV